MCFQIGALGNDPGEKEKVDENSCNRISCRDACICCACNGRPEFRRAVAVVVGAGRDRSRGNGDGIQRAELLSSAPSVLSAASLSPSSSALSAVSPVLPAAPLSPAPLLVHVASRSSRSRLSLISQRGYRKAPARAGAFSFRFRATFLCHRRQIDMSAQHLFDRIEGVDHGVQRCEPVVRKAGEQREPEGE